MISSEKLIELYSAMVKCRMIAERAGKLKSEGKICSALDAGAGHEATIAGIAVDLTREDTLSTTQEVLVSAFLQGTPLDSIFAANGRPHVATKNAPGETPLETACAAAKAHKASKNGKVAIAFCDAVPPHPGRWRRNLTVASKQNLPIVFVRQLEWCNGEEDKPARKNAAEDRPEALEFGVPVIQVDGNDVVAVYRVASESISRARHRSGPTVIDCITVSTDHGVEPQNDRPAGSVDPIVLMETHLTGKGLFNPEIKKKIERGFGRELSKATRLFSN